MNFWNLAVLGLTFFTPSAALLYVAFKGPRASGQEIRACALLFGLGMAAAALGVARLTSPVRMEFLWPLTLEQSGYFEFSLQLVWHRFVWVFFSAAMLLSFALFDASAFLAGDLAWRRLLFLGGAYLSSVLTLLSENVLLSVMFLEITVFLFHGFALERGEGPESPERSSYFKRCCFLFLALLALLGIAASRQISSGSMMILAAVLYLLSTLVSRSSPSAWGEVPLQMAQTGLLLFLLDRVMPERAPAELWVPLAVVFAAATAAFSSLSLLSPGALGSSSWMVLSVLGYALYVRFSSARPGDPFWGAYEAVALGMAYSFHHLFRSGARLDLLWKRVLAFLLVGVGLGVIFGVLPGVEAASVRFDGETSLARVVALGALTFLLSLVSAKRLAVSLGEAEEGSSSKGLLAALGPLLLVLAAQVGLVAKWNDLNFEGVGGPTRLLYDPRLLVASAAAAAGVLAGGLLGTNGRFAGWIKNRDLRMERIFPGVDPGIVRRSLELLQLPERSIARVSGWASAAARRAAGGLEAVDKTVFSERLCQAFSSYAGSLSRLASFFHSGQARAYLFLGVLVTLFSSMVFLMEGR